MADKLSESSWSSFAKKRDLDDAALVKALAKFDKTDDTKIEARLEAVADVIAQITKLIPALAKRKKELGDKPFTEAKDKLHDLLDEAEKTQKQAYATKAAKDAKASESSGDDEEDSPALLTTKMIPLLRQLRQPDVLMHGMVCTAGKNTAVLVMRRPIGASRRKLLSEAVDAQGGAKFIQAECLYENNALTFVVQSASGGLAKRIAAALLAQTKMRLKVRVRGEDGSQEEDGEDEDGSNAQADADAKAKKDGPSDSALLWAKRVPGVRAAVAAALKANHPMSSKLRAVMGFASEKAEGSQDYDAGLKALDMLEQLLKTAPGTTGTSVPPPPPPPEPSSKTTPKTPDESTVVSNVVYTQSRLAWVATRGKVKTEVEKLKKAILETYKSQPVIAEVTKSMGQLDAVLEQFDESLIDKLDEVLNETDLAKKQSLHDESREIIERYQSFLRSDRLVTQLDDNPFVPITVQKALTTTLSTLAAKIP